MKRRSSMGLTHRIYNRFQAGRYRKINHLSKNQNRPFYDTPILWYTCTEIVQKSLTCYPIFRIFAKSERIQKSLMKFTNKRNINMGGDIRDSFLVMLGGRVLTCFTRFRLVPCWEPIGSYSGLIAASISPKVPLPELSGFVFRRVFPSTFKKWGERRESNSRMAGPQPTVLTTSPRPPHTNILYSISFRIRSYASNQGYRPCDLSATDMR